MNNYRWNSVELHGDKEIPVLVACPQDRLEGVVLTGLNPPETRRVREGRIEDLDLFISDGLEFQARYGTVSESDSSRLLGLLQLIEALKHHDKTAWLAAAERLAVSPIKEFRGIERRTLLKNPGWQLGSLL